MKNVIVNENDKGKRLDIYIAENFNELSRTKIKKLIESNNILVNDNVFFFIKIQLNCIF